MKNLLLLLFVAFVNFTFAQNWDFEKPDYDKIEKNIKDKNSNLFYKSLWDRYLKADSTMTLEEKRHLFYGFTFNSDYSPYFFSPYRDSLQKVLSKEELTQMDYRKVVEITDNMIKDKPFDIGPFNYQLYALDQLGDTSNYDKRMIQLGIIIDALISSGNGITKEDAIYVIYTSNEYDLLSVFGFKFGGSQSLIEHYDYLTISDNEADIKGLYFDVSPSLNSLDKVLK